MIEDGVDAKVNVEVLSRPPPKAKKAKKPRPAKKKKKR